MRGSQAFSCPLPEPLVGAMTQLRNQLDEALGDNLLSMIVYGGVARGEWSSQRSDVNTMIVLKTIDVEALDRIAGPIQQGMRDFSLAAFVLTQRDLQRSTDVFPTKFLMMKQHYLLLHGIDVLEDLAIATDHLRLRCEQEIKNLLLRLRGLYVQQNLSSELLESTLSRSLSVLLFNLRILLQIKAGAAPIRNDAVIEAAATTLGMDSQVLKDIQTLRDGTTPLGEERLKQLYGAFMAEVGRAADFVDAM